MLKIRALLATVNLTLPYHISLLWILLFLNLKFYLCVFAYSYRTDKSICTKLGILIPWDMKEIFESSKDQIIIPSSISGKGGSRRWKTKHDRRTAPKTILFVSSPSDYDFGSSVLYAIVCPFLTLVQSFHYGHTLHGRSPAQLKCYVFRYNNLINTLRKCTSDSD
jgi:hypothetical protein